MNIVVYGGSREGADPAYAEAAEALGKRIASGGHTLVYGGGSVGIMGAVSNAALDGGAHVVGVIPSFMVEREWAHPGVPEMIVTKDMHERKHRMLELGDIYIAMPGGTGTQEEITEAVSWCDLGLISGKCYFVNINGFYDGMKTLFKSMLEAEYLHKGAEENVCFVCSVEELFSEIE